MYSSEPPSKRQRTNPLGSRSGRGLRHPERGYGPGRGDFPDRRRDSSRWGSRRPDVRPLRRPRAPGPPKPFKENRQFLNCNYRGALQEHLQREEGRQVNMIFTTDKMEYGEQDTLYISRCTQRGIHGEGYGSTRKEAVQQAAIDIIQKMGLATEEDVERNNRKSAEIIEQVQRNKKVDKPRILEFKSYQSGNFRGALLEYFQKVGIPARPSYATSEDTVDDGTKIFITTCAAGDKYESGIGHASTKKAAIHFASLDFLLKMGLLTMEEHLEKHPST